VNNRVSPLPYARAQSSGGCSGAEVACFSAGMNGAECKLNGLDGYCVFNEKLGFGRCKQIALFACADGKPVVDGDACAGAPVCFNGNGQRKCPAQDTNVTTCPADELAACCVAPGIKTDCIVDTFANGAAAVTTSGALGLPQPCAIKDGDPCGAGRYCRHFVTKSGVDAGYGICQ
jgi:hypothetical protein